MLRMILIRRFSNGYSFKMTGGTVEKLYCQIALLKTNLSIYHTYGGDFFCRFLENFSMSHYFEDSFVWRNYMES